MAAAGGHQQRGGRGGRGGGNNNHRGGGRGDGGNKSRSSSTQRPNNKNNKQQDDSNNPNLISIIPRKPTNTSSTTTTATTTTSSKPNNFTSNQQQRNSTSSNSKPAAKSHSKPKPKSTTNENSKSDQDDDRAHRRMMAADFYNEEEGDDDSGMEEDLGYLEVEDKGFDEDRARRRMMAADFYDDDDDNESEGNALEDEDDQEELELEDDEDDDDDDDDEEQEPFEEYEEGEEDGGELDDEDEFGSDDEGSGGEDEFEDEDAEEMDMEMDEEDYDKELARLKQELADVPLGDLIKVQQTMGTKAFRAMRGDVKVRNPHETNDQDEIDSREALRNKLAAKVEKEETSKERKVPPKRVSKHAPMEITSKKPTSRHRQVIEPLKKKGRDPRFDNLSGKFNEGLYKSSYGFLDEYDKSEIQMLKAEIRKEKDNEKKMELRKVLESKISRRQTLQHEDEKKKIMRDWKKTEKEAVKQGKKPYFLKESDVKKLALVEKYKKLNPSQVEKVLEKRRKKNSASEKRFMPYARRS
ncbi:rRNA biogenesis protein rrp36 [Blyttiomyces sp. JEL0837]|nr:rRNA biogenesis protein rrp36 [Blyttiomyces sp. JEL0837]